METITLDQIILEKRREYKKLLEEISQLLNYYQFRKNVIDHNMKISEHPSTNDISLMMDVSFKKDLLERLRLKISSITGIYTSFGNKAASEQTITLNQHKNNVSINGIDIGYIKNFEEYRKKYEDLVNSDLVKELMRKDAIESIDQSIKISGNIEETYFFDKMFVLFVWNHFGKFSDKEEHITIRDNDIGINEYYKLLRKPFSAENFSDYFVSNVRNNQDQELQVDAFAGRGKLYFKDMNNAINLYRRDN